MPSKPKGIHTSPEKAGEQNFPEGYAEKNHDKYDRLDGQLEIWNHGRHVLQEYKGLWTDEALEEHVYQYLKYCLDNEVKPCKAGLRLWLAVSNAQFYDWAGKPEKYGRKSEILNDAFDLIQSSYISRGEQFPTFNMFLLRSSHGHVEKNKVEVTTTNATTADEVKDTISKLGLDK